MHVSVAFEVSAVETKKNIKDKHGEVRKCLPSGHILYLHTKHCTEEDTA